MPSPLKDLTTNSPPRLFAYLCENGAYLFYDISSPVLRQLPASFIGLPVANIGQVQSAEMIKAFLAGADGVLIAGCEACQRQVERSASDTPFSAIVQALNDYAIDPLRVRREWIAAHEAEKFLRVVNEMMETLRHLPPLQLPAGLSKNLSYCG